MNRFFKWIKSIFLKENLALEQPKEIKVNENVSKIEDFLESIKVVDSDDDIMVIQRKLENGTIDEQSLSKQQVQQIKELYLNQISDLIDSINKYRKNNINA